MNSKHMVGALHMVSRDEQTQRMRVVFDPKSNEPRLLPWDATEEVAPVPAPRRKAREVALADAPLRRMTTVVAMRAIQLQQKYPRRFALASGGATLAVFMGLAAAVWRPPAGEVREGTAKVVVPADAPTSAPANDTTAALAPEVFGTESGFVGPEIPAEVLEGRAMSALRREVAAADKAAAKLRAKGKRDAARGRNAFVAAPDFADPHDFIWPVPSTYITSRFGERADPFEPEVAKIHRGVDVRCPTGTPIRAAGDGEVVVARQSARGGVSIRVRHANEVSTLYAHLASSAVKTGDKVKGGQIIGRSGNTGRSTGPHLHFEFWRGRKVMDPQQLSWREAPIGGGEGGTMTASRTPALETFLKANSAW